MKIIVEENIPYIKGRLEKFADVSYLPNEKITPEAVNGADALIVRTRTKCTEPLLAGSKCRFVGTATIGTDHIDLDYCRNNGICVANAPGCNAPAVAQYVISTIGHWMLKEDISDASCLTLGIVGVGHVGSIIERWAREVGLKVLLNDPPRERKEKGAGFVSLAQVAAEADIVTFHTPLIKEGADATFHLADEGFIRSLRRCRLLINSARGPIVDNRALVKVLIGGESVLKDAAIDCWENEPAIDRDLLRMAFVATPHIAGYSAEGKMRATSMVLKALSEHFGWKIDALEAGTPLKGACDVTLQAVTDSYNPLHDTETLKLSPETFEAQRNHYNLRHEVE